MKTIQVRVTPAFEEFILEIKQKDWEVYETKRNAVEDYLIDYKLWNYEVIGEDSKK